MRIRARRGELLSGVVFPPAAGKPERYCNACFSHLAYFSISLSYTFAALMEG